MGRVLNTHLRAKNGLATRPCNTFSIDDLQSLLRRFQSLAHPQLLTIYTEQRDRRQTSRGEDVNRKNLLTQLAAHVRRNASLGDVLRDGHCHEVVMTYVHHLASEAQRTLAAEHTFVLPLLPEHAHVRSPSAHNAGPEKDVYDSYAAAVSCQVCHSGVAPSMPGSDPSAPAYPPPVAPNWPYQFEAEVVGWNVDSRNPKGTNVSGTWHYDFINNRMAQYFVGKKSNMQWWPLKTNVTLVWIAAPTPAGEDGAEAVYGKGAARGTFYAFVKPQPFLPRVCEKIPYPSFSVPLPDSFSSKGISSNITYVAREWVDGRWADRYHYDFLPGNSCDGPFNLWKDIYDNLPVKDFGKNDCKGGNASTHWKTVHRRAPPLWRWQNLDYASCKESSDVEDLEQRIVASAVAAASALGHSVDSQMLAEDVGTALRVAGRHLPPSKRDKASSQLVV